MHWLRRFKEFLLGKPKNPLNPETQRHISLVVLLAWIGLGADGLSSACYGPEEAYLALGQHSGLALYIAIATVLTVFLIALVYNQVIELFPSGGGGYKVATRLLGAHAGLISGSALIVDYVLTITISVASGGDALFSLLPVRFLPFKLTTELILLLLLTGLNLRGMKESIKLLTPIFLSFIVIHFGLIGYGIWMHEDTLPKVLDHTLSTTTQLNQTMGVFFTLALLLRAYSLGGGTYTGIEAVSNNVNRLAEPRVRTGKWTMFCIALSLSVTAGGIILLYLLWDVSPVHGQTLNAVVFGKILGDSSLGHHFLMITLILEACLLFVAANSGFLAGPNVLANMAIDQWLPNRFRHFSSRLVVQNGVIVFGVIALLILWLSHGEVSWLVVLYSINVFLTFSLAILGLCVYWWKHKKTASKYWIARFIFSSFAFLVTASILITTFISKFASGAWVTAILTGCVILLCLAIKKYYLRIARKLNDLDRLMTSTSLSPVSQPRPLQPAEPTAVIMIAKHRGVGVYTLLWVLRMFPNHFKNFIFLTVGIVDVESFSGQSELRAMQEQTDEMLEYFIRYCRQQGLAAKGFSTYGTDAVEKLTQLAQEIIKSFPNSIFFASKLIFERERWITRVLHNETAETLQRRLHLMGAQLVILPMKVSG
jgi:amino acid transporter